MTPAQSNTSFLRYRTDSRALFALLLLLLLTYLPLLYNQIPNSADYKIRIQQAYSLIESGAFNSPTPNILYSGLVALAGTILPLDLSNAAVIVTLFCYLAAGVMVYAVLRRHLAGYLPMRLTMLLVFLTFTLLTIAPITTALLFSTDRMLYDYIVISPHYNPTIPLLRPFALVTLLTAVPIFETGQSVRSWRFVLYVAVMILISVWAKPNWSIALFPALILAVAWYRLRQNPVNWRLLAGGYGVPILLMIALQYWLTYTGHDSEASQVTIAPLRAILGAETPVWILPFTLLLSMLFPLYIGWRYFAEARKDTAWWLAALTFVMALIQGLILDENGARQGHGNFLWGATIALFIWFVMSVRLFLRVNLPVLKREVPANRDFIIGAVIYGLHALVGILWLLAHFSPIPIMLG